LIQDGEQASGMGADFLEHDGDIPGGLEAGGGWFRGWRLGVCRGGAEEDNQPHCFNLSRGMGGSDERAKCPRGANYSSPPGGGGDGGAGGAPVGAPVPVPVLVPLLFPVLPVQAPVFLHLSPLGPEPIGPPLVPGPLGRW
jgi:hypothetical protein